MNALFLEHDTGAPPALVGSRAAARGLATTVVRVGRDPFPPIADVDLLIVMGSEKSAADESNADTRAELSFVHKAVETDLPVLGICFGSQLLARVLGGEVFRAPVPEIGWYHVESDDPLLVPRGPWFQWHYDRFTLPPGAVEIARSDAGSQAYALGPHLGVQFHPEVTPELVDLWLDEGPDITAHGFSADMIRKDTARFFPTTRLLVDQLFDAFLESTAILPSGDR